MKLGTVTKRDKRIKTMPKNNVISANCDVIAFFTIYDQFGTIWKPDTGSIVCKTNIFINSNLISCKH